MISMTNSVCGDCGVCIELEKVFFLKKNPTLSNMYFENAKSFRAFDNFLG